MLASARLTLADVALREEEARGDEAMAAMATDSTFEGGVVPSSPSPVNAAALSMARRRRRRGIGWQCESRARGRRKPVRRRGHSQS